MCVCVWDPLEGIKFSFDSDSFIKSQIRQKKSFWVEKTCHQLSEIKVETFSFYLRIEEFSSLAWLDIAVEQMM